MVRFSKMKLTNLAKMYWQNVLQDIIHLGEPPITQWAVMKEKLQEKYILLSYKSQSFSSMINLKQMTLSVAKYSAKFEEARLSRVSSMLRINLLSALVLLMVSSSTFKGWLNCMVHTL